MALERIDPFLREDRLSLDHVLRYYWAVDFIEGKRVADVACGTGFGTTILAHGNAAEVIGIDASEEAIQACREAWDHPAIRFRSGDIANLSHILDKPCDRVVCFETLEHLKRPADAVTAIAGALKSGGLLIGSVPAESDVFEGNAYHEQVFNEAGLTHLLQAGFNNVRILRQRYNLASLIEMAGDSEGEPVTEIESPLLRFNFGGAPEMADTYLFLASDGPLPESKPLQMALSRGAWVHYFMDSQRAFREVSTLQSRFRSLFFEHGDLKRRFTNLLAWGQYYHSKATGKSIKGGYMKRIEKAQSNRETTLRQEVESLRAEVKDLRRQIREQLPDQKEILERRRQHFEEMEKGNPADG